MSWIDAILHWLCAGGTIALGTSIIYNAQGTFWKVFVGFLLFGLGTFIIRSYYDERSRS